MHRHSLVQHGTVSSLYFYCTRVTLYGHEDLPPEGGRNVLISITPYATISDPFRICFVRGLLLLCASCVVYYIRIQYTILQRNRSDVLIFISLVPFIPNRWCLGSRGRCRYTGGKNRFKGLGEGRPILVIQIRFIIPSPVREQRYY